MKARTSALLAFLCATGMSPLSSAQVLSPQPLRLKLCSVVMTIGSRAIAPKNVEIFARDRVPTVINESAGNENESARLIFEESSGCLVAELPASWTQFRIEFHGEGSETRTWGPKRTIPSKNLKGDVRIKGNELWLEGGLKANGDPVYAMLFLLDLESSDFLSASKGVLDDGKATERSLLEQISFGADLIANYQRELDDAQKHEGQLTEDAGKLEKQLHESIEQLLISVTPEAEQEARARYARLVALRMQRREFHELIEKSARHLSSIGHRVAELDRKYNALRGVNVNPSTETSAK